MIAGYFAAGTVMLLILVFFLRAQLYSHTHRALYTGETARYVFEVIEGVASHRHNTGFSKTINRRLCLLSMLMHILTMISMVSRT